MNKSFSRVCFLKSGTILKKKYLTMKKSTLNLTSLFDVIKMANVDEIALAINQRY
jgi:hypothetical protein